MSECLQIWLHLVIKASNAEMIQATTIKDGLQRNKVISRILSENNLFLDSIYCFEFFFFW